jgi:hypothetical protein
MGLDQEISRLIDAIQRDRPNLPLHFRGAVQVFRAGMWVQGNSEINQ